MVLEVGIGIIAICLPSIWMVVVAKAPEAFLRSVHSLVSLASIGTRGSKESRDRSQPKTLQSNASTSSHIPIAGSSSDTYELAIAGSSNLEAVPEREIHVKRSVEQSSEARL